MLTDDEKQMLSSAGFIDEEIHSLDTATTPGGNPQQENLYSPVWQNMIQSRREWTTMLLSKGLSNNDIREMVLSYYKRGKRSIFDFLKAEYKPKTRVDYYAATKKRKRLQIESAMGSGSSKGGRYGKYFRD